GIAMPLPMVAATERWKMNSAMKLNEAANRMACCGFRTPVDTTVAMEFAASWKPFMKSNTTASTTSKTTTQKLTCIASIKRLSDSKRGALGILEDHALDQVGHVFAAIGDGFELLVDRLQLDQLANV